MDQRTKLASPPKLSLLPPTVLSAELQRGTIVHCGPGVRGVGWPETSQVRSAALEHMVPKSHLVAVLTTAAWVWGCAWHDQAPLTFSTLQAKRYLGLTGGNCRVHEFNIKPNDIIQIMDVFVTSPLRTVYDLLFISEEQYSDAYASLCAELCDRFSKETNEIVAFIRSSRRPYLTRAIERLQAL